MKRYLISVICMFMLHVGNGAYTPAGLVNLGNSCYMNSALQMLANTKDLRDHFKNQASFPDNTLSKSFKEFLILYDNTKDNSFSPSGIHDTVRELTKAAKEQYADGSQHDAEEFLSWLFEKVDEESGAGEGTVIKNNFRFQTYNSITRLTCGANTVNLGFNYVLQLSLEKDKLKKTGGEKGGGCCCSCCSCCCDNIPVGGYEVDLIELFGHFIADSMSPVDCTACKSQEQAKHNTKISSAYTPRYLIIRVTGPQDLKKSTNILLPMQLDITPYCTDPAMVKAKYNLYGVIKHSGGSYGGHYTAVVKHDGQWFFCNDSCVSQIENPIEKTSNNIAGGDSKNDDILSKKYSFNGCVFFYERVD